MHFGLQSHMDTVVQPCTAGNDDYVLSPSYVGLFLTLGATRDDAVDYPVLGRFD